MSPESDSSARLMPTTLIELLRRRAVLQPDHCVYSFLPDDATATESHFTHAELDKRARAIGAELQAMGAGGERVLLLYPPGLNYIAAFFGCLYAGAIAVPIYPPRPKRDVRRLQAVVADAQATVALTTTALLAKLEPCLTAAADLLQVRWLATDTLPDEGAAQWHEPQVNGQTIAFLQYTSGSTAQPRAVVLKHETVLGNAALIQQCFETSPQSHGVFWLPFYHDMGLLGGLLQPLYCGGRSTLLSPLAFLQRPLRWLETISRTGADISGGPNFAYDLCVRKITAAERATLDLSSWRLAFNGAEPIRAETLARFTATFAACGFRGESFYPCYGLAEATLIVTGGTRAAAPVVGSFDAEALERNEVQTVTATTGEGRNLVSSGRIRTGQNVVIVDLASRKQAGPGQVGEVWVAGPSVAGGYWNRSEETLATFDAHLSDTGAGPFLRTGDLGFLDHEELFVTGRIKDLIIIRGRNYQPHDIELTVEQVSAALRPGGCAAFSIAADGVEQLAIVAETERQYRQLDLTSLMDQIRLAVGEHHELQVQALALVKPGVVPRTTSGKLQRQACRKKFLANELEVISRWEPNASHAAIASAASRVESASSEPAADSHVQIPAPQTSAEISRSRADELIGWLRSYSSERINSRLIDERRCIPPYVVLDLGNRGILGMEVPEEYGGIALRARDALRVVEQLAAIDLTLASFVGVNNVLGVRPILRFAESGMRDELLPILARGRELAAFALTEPGAGSNPRAITSVGVPDGAGGWRLHGTKSWIGSASWAGVTNVFVKLAGAPQHQEGITAFWVRQGTPGLRQGTEALTMGMRGMVQNAIHLEDVAVGPSNLLGAPGNGFAVAQDAMMFGRLGLGAMSVGGMKRCAQLMLRFAGRREIATGRLLDNPITRARLSALTAELAGLEALVTRIAELVDEGRAVPAEAFSVCKIAGPEFLWSAADTLVQLLGGRGYIESNLAPQLLRDARLLRIFEGPTETLNMFLGSSVLHGQQLDQFMQVELGAANVAGVLRDTVAQIDSRSKEFGVAFNDPTAGRRWIASLVGQTATSALLWAALQDAATRNPSPPQRRAVECAQRAFEQTKRRALDEMPAASTLLSTAATTELIEGYAEAIGDLEQNLGGADHEMDSLLRRGPVAKESRSLKPFKADRESHDSSGNGGWLPGASKQESRGGPERQAAAPDSQTAPSGALAGERAIVSQLQQFLAAALRLPAATLDVERPLYSLGLDSLIAVELKNHIEECFGVVLPITTFLEEISLAQLAGQVTAKRVSATPSRGSEFATSAEPFTEHSVSCGQQALWLLSQLAPESTAYNVSVAFRISGPVDQGALSRALQLLVDRHPALRTTFATRDGEPIQRVHARVVTDLPVEQARSWTEARLHAAIGAEVQRTFDLANGPLLRARLFSSAPDAHVLVLVLHHIIEDSWSLGLILYELARLYTAEHGGAPAALLPLQYSYVDFVHKQREMLIGAEGERLWTYWQAQLAGAPTILNLPTDRPHPPMQNYRGAAHSIRLSATLGQGLRALSEAQGATLYMTLLAAFQVLLYRYTGQEDILVGSPMLGRSGAELAGVVGYFANPVVLRAQFVKSPTFTEFLGQVRGAVHEAFAHQDFPFSLLVERLQPQRDASRSPLFQTMFTLQKDLADNVSLLTGARVAAGTPLDLAGVPLERYPLEHHFAQFELSLMVTELRAGIEASFEYNCDQFDEATIKRLAANFETLLESIVATPDGRVANLPLLTEAEQNALLAWGGKQTIQNLTTKTQRALAGDATPGPPAAPGVAFSLFYFSCNEAEFADDKYQLLIEGAKFADRAGFTAVWTPERHFHAFGGIYPNPSVLGAALAMITDRVRIRAGSVVLPLHNPIRVAEEWAVVDNLARGRVDLAFATGWSARDFILAPERHARRKEIMFSAIEAVRRLWRGESLVLPDAEGHSAEVRIHPLPMQSELPVWITCAGNPEGFRAAGEIGANVLTTLLMQSVAELAERIALYRAARARSGFDPDAGQVSVMLHTFVGESEPEVRARVLPPFTEYLRTSVELWGHEAKKLEELSESERADLLTYSCERYFQTSALFGTPQVCAGMVERLQAIGVNEIACLIDFGVDVPSVMSSLHLLDALRQKFAPGPLTSKQERLAQPKDTDETGTLNQKTIQQLIEAQVEKTPARTALICDGESLTYSELNERANQVARHLRKLGVEAEKLVGILLDRSTDMVVAMLGVLKSGGAYVPLDPTHPPARLALMLADARASVLLTHDHLVKDLPSTEALIVCLDTERATIAAEPQTNLSSCVDGDNSAYVIYTSGSTGRPKGVQVSHLAVVNFLRSLQQQIGLMPADKMLAVTNLSFDIAALELLLPLTVGAMVELASRPVAADGGRLGAKLSSSGATVMQATPATWRLLLESGWEGSEHLQILCGGEAVSRELANQLSDRGTHCWNLYGPTETTIWSTLHRVAEREGPVPLGGPIANTRLYVLDRYMQLGPVGVPGELYIGGAGLARGYLHQAELTAERFAPDPFSDVPGGRLYRTGDVVRYLADGRLEFLGRADQQIKIRGHRVELGEIEAVLQESTAVRDAMVLAREDTPGEQRLVAYLLTDSPEQPMGDELRAFLQERLPNYMLPTAFIPLAEWPLTANGKVDRKALPAPENQRSLAAAYLAPQSEIEQLIAAVWRDVLAVDRVGTRDNFFDLGGHSLLLARVHSRLRGRLPREVSMIELFRYPTISSLAAHLNKAWDDSASVQHGQERAQARQVAMLRRRQQREAAPER